MQTNTIIVDSFFKRLWKQFHNDLGTMKELSPLIVNAAEVLAIKFINNQGYSEIELTDYTRLVAFIQAHITRQAYVSVLGKRAMLS